MIIHRILSAILLVFIVWPVFIIHCLAAFIFSIVNSFTYHNFWERVIVPEAIWQKLPRTAFNEVVARISLIMVSSFYGLLDNLKGIKTSKF